MLVLIAIAVLLFGAVIFALTVLIAVIVNLLRLKKFIRELP